MDNGLIFPYPCVRVPDESIVLTTQTVDRSITFGVRRVIWLRGTRLVVVKRWGDAGR